MSGQGPSSNVSATTWRLREPLLTNDGPLGTHPTTRGTCTLNRAGVAGNRSKHRVCPGLGTHAAPLSVLITCQRIGTYVVPMSPGRNVAVSSRALERPIVAAIRRPGAGPLPVIRL